MSEVFVHGPWLALGRCDWYAFLGRVVEQRFTAWEYLVELGNTPWCDDLDGGLQSVEGEFEAYLVVALARATVGDVLAVFLLSNGDLGTSNDRACEGGTEEIYLVVC
jgi:hypothetical protein